MNFLTRRSKMRHNKILFLLPVMSFFVVLFTSLLIHAQEPPGDYLVMFGEGISVVDREIAVRNAGAVPRFNYYIVPGAAVHIPNVRALEALQRNPRVVTIIPDRKVYAHVIATG